MKRFYLKRDVNSRKIIIPGCRIHFFEGREDLTFILFLPASPGWRTEVEAV